MLLLVTILSAVNSIVLAIIARRQRSIWTSLVSLKRSVKLLDHQSGLIPDIAAQLIKLSLEQEDLKLLQAAQLTRMEELQMSSNSIRDLVGSY